MDQIYVDLRKLNNGDNMSSLFLAGFFILMYEVQKSNVENSSTIAR